MPQGSKPGERRGGRKPGTPNKATIERERKALEALQQRARAAEGAPTPALAMNELAALIPEAKELLGVVKGVVRRFQEAALAPPAKGESPSVKAAAWRQVKEWMTLYSEVMLKTGQIADKAAAYQSPKYGAIAVHMVPDHAHTIEHQADNVIPINDPVAASRVYQRRMQGGGR